MISLCSCLSMVKCDSDAAGLSHEAMHELSERENVDPGLQGIPDLFPTISAVSQCRCALTL